MASPKILYTTVDAIRSSIGVDNQDLSDAMVLGINLDLLMLERLDEVYPLHEDNSDDAVDRKLRLWCQYYGAWTLITDVSLGIPMKIQANTDAMQRFPIDFEKVAASLKLKITKLEGQLNVNFATATPTVISRVSPGYDPITGV